MVNRIDGNNYHIYTKQQNKGISGAGEKFSLEDNGNESLQNSGSKYEKDVSDSGKNPFEERNGVKLEISGAGRSQSMDVPRQKNIMEAGSASGQPLLETIRNYVLKAVTAVRDFFYQIWNDEPKRDGTQDAAVSVDSFDSEKMKNSMDTDNSMDMDNSIDDMSVLAAIDSVDEIDVVDPVNFNDGKDSINATDAKESTTVRKRLSILPLQDELPDYEIRQSLKEGDMERVIRLLTDNGKKTAAKNSTLLTSYDRNGKIVEPNASDRGKILYGDRSSLKF